MMSMNFIEELSDKRSRWIDTNRENGFEEGLSRLLSELYPDNAHFLYELLQNAEDAQASKVSFKLTANQMSFTHDGRAFEEVDVDGITGIGNTKKKDDLNTIGKFGVGFKAVFSYTTMPHIYSDSFCFGIMDMVCPITMDRPDDLASGLTRFDIPLDNPKKPHRQAFEEISEGLNNFSSATLLFLHNIKEIRWEVIGEKEHFLRLDEEEEFERLRVYSVESDSAGQSIRWVRLSAPCKEAPQQSVSIAFRLEAKKINKNQYSLQIVETDGSLCIFFPADKETTNLRFHIHAPFVSTVARDSIPCTNHDNISLRDQLVQLLVDSLPTLRDEGLLSTDFLGVLPNDTDGLNGFYEPFMSAVVETMKTQPLVPIRSGGHEPAQNLTKPVGRIHEVITDSDLEFLTDGERKLWVSGVLRNTSSDRFLSLLGIEEWSVGDLQNVIEEKWASLYSGVAQEDIDWLSSKEIAWIRSLYLFLAGEDVPYSFKRAVIVVTADGVLQKGQEVVFCPEGNGGELKGIDFLHPEILVGKKEQRAKIKAFLEEVGVCELDEKHFIQSILQECYLGNEGKALAVADHLKHMKRFVEYWKQTDDVRLFNGSSFLLSDEDRDYHAPEEVFLDEPLKSTGLKPVLHTSKHQITQRYDQLSKANKEHFVAFAEALGVQVCIELEGCMTPWGVAGSGSRETHTKIDRDYKLPSAVKKIMEEESNIEISLLVWKMMCGVDRTHLRGLYRPNQSHGCEGRPSVVVEFLKEQEWIPSRSGNFHKPGGMTLEQLPVEFVPDDNNGWLTAIEFGRDVKAVCDFYPSENGNEKKKVESDAFDNQLREEGIEMSPGEIRALNNVPLDKRKKFLEDYEAEEMRRKVSFPESTPKNPERRKKKTIEGYADAPAKTSEKRNRTVRTSRSSIDPRPYLRNLCTNADGQLICQMCEEEMPFKLRNGNYHLEAVQLFDDADKEMHQIYLALCPVCAAKYQFLVKKHDACIDSFKRAILNIEAALIFSIDMHNPNLEPLSVRFTETHLLDIRTILDEENNPEDKAVISTSVDAETGAVLKDFSEL